MRPFEPLVSIGLPVRNGADRLAKAVASVLAQDYEMIELVISDNASTDRTEEVCRELAKSDSRIVYHRQPHNVGLLNNFISTMRIASGTFMRWMGDDDWLAPACISNGLEVFAGDDRLVLVTGRTAYTSPGGVTIAGVHDAAGLRSDDPVERLTEILRLLNESPLLIDPLYGLMRRKMALAIPRRNMLKEDEVFATKLALAGPWGHVPEVLAYRQTNQERISDIARKLDVPSWQTYVATILQCREIMHWIRQADLTPEQRRAARAAVARMYLRRQRRTLVHRGRKLASLATGLAAPAQGESHLRE